MKDELFTRTLNDRGWIKVSDKVYGYMPNNQLKAFVHIDVVQNSGQPPDDYLADLERHYQ